MAAPSSYTEATLKQFVVDELGSTGVTLSLTTSSNQVVNTVYAVERVLSVSDVATVTDMPKLEAVTRWLAWRTAKGAASGQFDVTLTGGKRFQRSQFWDHINNMLRDAEAAASRYSEVLAILGGSVPMPYAGGLSRSDKRGRETDTDRAAPFFTRAMHDPVGAASEVD